MADNATACAATGTVIFATDEDGSSIHWPYTKVVFGAADTQTIVQTSAPLPVMVTHFSAGMSVSISGGVTIKDVSNGVAINISTMPNVTIANPTAISITDSHSVVVSNVRPSESDYDTGAGTESVGAFGIVVPASGGAARVTTAAPFPIMVTGISAGVGISVGGTVEIGGDVSLTGAVAISGTAAVVFSASSVLDSISKTVAVAISTSSMTPVTVTGGLVIASITAVTPITATAGIGIAGNVPVTFVDGSVTVDAISATVNVELATISSGLKLSTLGAVSATVTVHVANSIQSLLTGIEASAGTVSTPLYRSIVQGTASGSALMVTGVAAKRLRVLSMQVVAGTAQTFHFNDGTAGTALTGPIKLAANGGFILPTNEHGWFETSASKGIHISCSATLATLGGCITYITV